MKVFSSIVLLAVVALAQGGRIRNPLNPDNLPDRIVLYKDIVTDPKLRQMIVEYEESSSRIVGGNEATPNEYPHQVGLRIDNAYFCGGSLIAADKVLTAAHCADNAQEIKVIAGAHNINNAAEPTQQSITSRNFKVHENWRPNLIINDTAIINLPTRFTLNDQVAIVGVSRKNVGDGIELTVSGWGRPSDNVQTISPVLREVDVVSISNDECAGVYGVTIQPSTLCISTKGGKGTCNGDSGGPLIFRTVTSPRCQVGVVSFGSSAGCERDYPAGFARVESFADWIETNSGVKSTC